MPTPQPSQVQPGEVEELVAIERRPTMEPLPAALVPPLTFRSPRSRTPICTVPLSMMAAALAPPATRPVAASSTAMESLLAFITGVTPD
jgi:hypothetical protein